MTARAGVRTTTAMAVRSRKKKSPATTRILFPDAFSAMGTEGRILQAALACIAQHGIAATTTHAIARRAGLQQGIIHYHFRNKDELLMRMLELLFREGMANMQTIARSELSPRDKVAQVIEMGHRFITRRHDVFVVYIALWAHAIAQGGKWREAYMKLLKGLIGSIRTIIRSGERSGDFRKGVSAAASALLVASIQGLGLQTIKSRNTAQQRETKTFFATFMAYVIDPCR